MSEKLKIFYGVNESGVAFWRGKLPGRKIIEKDLADLYMFSIYDSRASDLEQIITKADVVYCPSPCGVESVVEFVKYYQLGKATVADYDDNLFDCHPFNPGYSTLGLKEVKVRLPDGREDWLWKDQRKGFSLKDNKIRFNSHVDVLNVSSLVTTTTPYLKNVLRENVTRDEDDFSILPNSIDFNLFRTFPKKNGKKLRIGWAASDSHLLECQMIAKIIRELHAKRDDFEFVILGNIIELRRAVKDYPVEWHEFTDLSVYPLKLASLHLDIGLCPLEDFSFNRSKSCLKWSEYSAMKVASVCSDLDPYHMIKDGIDGMLAKSADEFIQKIEVLLDDSKLRADISESSFQRNFEEYNLDINVHKWMETFERAYLRRGRTLMYKGEQIPVEAS